MKQALASSPAGDIVSRAVRPIRLMLVDDSMVARAVLSRMIDADGHFDIVGVAGTAEDAIVALGHVEVDIVLLDLEMPGVGGLKSIPRIIEAAHGARIMIVSSAADEGAEETVAALAMGAADTLPKPGTGRFNGRFSEILITRLRALGHAKSPQAASRKRYSSDSSATPHPLRIMAGEPLSLLALGASTGGIHALGTFLAALPAVTGVPILITQHLPPAFMSVFARQLGVVAKRPAVVAEDGMKLVADTLFIAPGDAHLTVSEEFGERLIRLVHFVAGSGCLPSVDPMLASAGAVAGRGALGVVLTGMGRDGVEGAAKLVACGGSVLAQDEVSSAVWGMPRAVVEAGLAAGILPPDQLARRVAARCIEA